MTPHLPPDAIDDLEKLGALREKLIAGLQSDHDGRSWCIEHATLADQAVNRVWQSVLGMLPEVPRLAIIATGGYGRRELAPYSDIDITVVPVDAEAPNLDETLRTLFRFLHASLGTVLKFEIGYAYRLVGDVAGLDPVSRTGLLDARLVAGSQRVYNALMDAFWESMQSGEFVLTKMTERAQAARKFNDSPLAIEPHLKEGVGGLRSFQTANWIQAAIGERPTRLGAEYERLLNVRNLMHRAAGRKQDHLTRTRQGELCELFGFAPQPLMTEVFRSLLCGQEVYESTLDRVREARFGLSESVTALRGEARVASPAEPGVAAVGIAIATKLGLGVHRVPSAFTDSINGPAALYACSNGEATLRNLDKCGILARILPELDACRTIIPGDGAHAYTIFEHTMRVVRRLDGVDQEPFISEVLGSISDVEPLYLAALLHDVAKPSSEATGRGHDDEGADVAERVCERWGLAESTRKLVSWLVREHLTMSLFIRIRDIHNPATTAEFAALVESPDRLAMLTLLTWADISAVNDESFTPAQAAYLRELYGRTIEALHGEEPTAPEASVARRRLMRQLKSDPVSNAKIEAFVESLPAYYLTTASSDLVRLHHDYAMRAREGEITIETNARPDLNATEVTLCAPDRAGLLGSALGVFYAYDLSVQDIRACTTSGDSHVALDAFKVSFGGRMVPTGTWSQVSSALRSVIAGQKDVSELLIERGKDPSRRQNVLLYTLFDGDPQLLEVQSPRGRGMAYRIAHTLSERGFNILSARVGQWGGSAAAAFYLEPSDDARERIEAALGV